MDLTGKAALVTGGTMGIGKAIALDLARGGADVAIVARHLGEAAETVKAEIEKLGRQCHLMVGDVAKREDCIASVNVAAEVMRKLDILVHNAGGPSAGRIDDVEDDQWLATMDLHVNALFYLCKAALPHLRQRDEAAIISISSTAGILGVEGAIAYATAKGAVPHFTRCLARELAPDNIRVNCIAPGVIRTRFHDDMTDERKQLNLDTRIPLGREGTSEQVAQAVRTLITNDYITGETLVIDGGLTSRIC